MNVSQDLHCLNGYIHNVASLLRFLKEDAVIENKETKEMLELAILKEESSFLALDNIKRVIKNDE